MSRFGIYPIGCDIRNAVVASVTFNTDLGGSGAATVVDDASQLIKSITMGAAGVYTLDMNDKWKSIAAVANYASPSDFTAHVRQPDPAISNFVVEVLDDTNLPSASGPDTLVTILLFLGA